jgi:hypothetical protein
MFAIIQRSFYLLSFLDKHIQYEADLTRHYLGLSCASMLTARLHQMLDDGISVNLA